MSGPEWTAEHSDAPAEGRPLSGEVGAEGPTPSALPPIIGPNPFKPGRARPDDDARAAADDDAAAQANLDADDAEAAPAGPNRIAALVGSIRAAAAGLRARRRRADPGAAADPEAGPDPDPAEPTADGPAPAPADAETAGAPSARWSPAAWSWETRVGLAAVLSFLILVGVLVVKKGWIGGKRGPITASMPKPADADKKAPAPDLARRDKSPETVASPPAPGGAEAQPAPSAPPTAPSAAAGNEAPAQDPLSAPATGGALAALTPGDNPANATASDPSKPPELPPTPADAPPLPATPAGDGLPTMPTAEAGAGAEAKLPEPAARAAEGQPPEPTTTPEPAGMPAAAATAAAPTPSDPPAREATPSPEPATAAAPPPSVTPLEPARVKNLEPVPTSTPDAPAPSRGPEWVVIPSSGKRPGAGAAGGSGGGGDAEPTRGAASSRTRIADGPPIQDQPAVGAGEALHTVQPDENFWTISKDFYGSGRYYKALHQANASRVPDIAKLYVGTVIRIPRPETLDRTLVERTLAEPAGAPIDGPAVSRASSSTRSADAGADMSPPRTARPGLRRARSEPAETPRRPVYRVKANDTLRSIARDTLDDSRRSGEIYNLNRDMLDGPKATLTPGTTLTLPDDAVIGRQIR